MCSDRDICISKEQAGMMMLIIKLHLDALHDSGILVETEINPEIVLYKFLADKIKEMSHD